MKNKVTERRKDGIMSPDIIPAPVRRPTKEDIFRGEPCASAGGNMSERHGIMSPDIMMSPDIIPAPVRRPTKEGQITYPAIR